MMHRKPFCCREMSLFFLILSLLLSSSEIVQASEAVTSDGFEIVQGAWTGHQKDVLDVHNISYHHVGRRLNRNAELDSHRVLPHGFDWYSPWSSGTFLRRPPLSISVGKGTLIIYSIVPNLTLRNFHFYLVAVIDQLALRSGRSNSAFFTHCFVANGPLSSRSSKLFGMMGTLPHNHKMILLNATSTVTEQPYRPSRQLGFVSGQLDMTQFSNFVFLESRIVGPFFPPFWDNNKYPVWTDAYTSLLSDEVRVVGRYLACTPDKGRIKSSAEKAVPAFEGPLAFDRTALELAAGSNFEIFGEKFVYSILRAGYNVLAMHGQPRGHDWRRWLTKAPTDLCNTEIPDFLTHPFEGLFVNRNRKLASGFESVYMKNVRKHKELRAVRQSMLADLKMTEETRLLVLYAYYEKNAQYKENLMYFLKTAARIDAGVGAPVDYVLIINGEHTVQIPPLNNLQVIMRNNSCLDFGSWGVGLTKRTKKHAYFFVINASVKGPFLPIWFTDHWSRSFISQLQGEVAAVGLSVNCPDGVGRGVPHIMSMAVMFDRRVMDLAEKKGLFTCVESYKVGLSRESDFSMAILAAGYNIGSMQTAQNGVDFREHYHRYLADAKNISSGCAGIDLDIFFKEGWYQGMSPNPMEFVFLKVSRGVNTQTTEIVTNIEIENARHQITQLEKVSSKHILMMMHSLDMDGAPRLLFEMGAMLVRQGFVVTFAAWQAGSLARSIAALGSKVVIINPETASSVTAILDGLFLEVDLVIFNTVVWADLLGHLPFVRTDNPKLMWLIHENELSPQHAVENSHGDKFWYGMEYSQIKDDDSIRRTLQKVDRVVFVADKVRAIWSKFDTGHFETFRGFVGQSDVEKRAAQGLNPSSRKALMEAVGITAGTFVMTTLGTVCKRKGQYLLAQALENVGGEIFGSQRFVLLVVGAPSEDGGRGDNKYFDDFSKYVRNSAVLSRVVKFIPFSNKALGYLALSNLHLSVSRAEAFPLNVLEAMALGVPAMVTPAGGSEEAFLQPGVDGLLLPKITTREGLETAIVTQLKGKLGDLPAIGAAGKLTFQSRFSAEASAPRLTGLVDRVFNKRRGAKGNVCVVVRTYAGHMTDPIFSLQSLLRSLQAQHYPHWTAFVANTDSKPMDGLYSLLSELNDHRLHVVDPPEPEKFRLGSFPTTDRVVAEQCPHNSDWLLVTNGDNYYEPSFFDHLDLTRDVIAYDFYSRSSHILDSEVVGVGCKKFFSGPMVACKMNLLKHWHTDLGSYVINFKRWRLEGRSFVPFEKDGDGSADGHVAESLVYYEWPVKSVGQGVDGCLFSHSPNMYYCLNNSAGVSALWDAETNACVVDSAAQAALRKTHRPYNSPVLPYSMRLFQDRCMELRR